VNAVDSLQISSIQEATRQMGDNITRIETLQSRLLSTLPETSESEVGPLTGLPHLC
jgi:t-SNARE complex subunit (syntaxin)